ncbi:hypothetical protein JW930_03405 [Candidatus Woesearchaeota archaeon]|nr:hypothetical protein [Candidatus Woesearchaeota archaeon]
MKCIKCGKKAGYRIQNNHLCQTCFSRTIEKRVRKELRLKRLIKKNDQILVLDDGSLNAQTSIYLLKKIIKGLPANIRTKKKKYSVLGGIINSTYNKIIIPWTLDHEIYYYLECLLNGKCPHYLGHYKLGNKLYIKLLLPITQEESKTYAEINKVSFKTPGTIRLSTQFSLDELEKEFPEIKYSLYQATQQLKKIYKDKEIKKKNAERNNK